MREDEAAGAEVQDEQGAMAETAAKADTGFYDFPKSVVF